MRCRAMIAPSRSGPITPSLQQPRHVLDQLRLRRGAGKRGARHRAQAGSRTSTLQSRHRLARAQAARGRVDSYDAAVAHAPEHAEALVNRGTCSSILGATTRPARAMRAALHSTLGGNPQGHASARTDAHLRLDEPRCGKRGSQSGGRRGRVASLPHHLLPCSSDPRIQLICAKSFMQDQIGAAFVPLWRGERYSHARFAWRTVVDFRDHAVSQLAVGLFEHHDRGRFETVAISSGSRRAERDARPPRGRFRATCRCRRARRPGGRGLVRDLEVDIAVDLSGLTAGARPGVFARRPAPVQVNYLGCPRPWANLHSDYIWRTDFVIPELPPRLRRADRGAAGLVSW